MTTVEKVEEAGTQAFCDMANDYTCNTAQMWDADVVASYFMAAARKLGFVNELKAHAKLWTKSVKPLNADVALGEWAVARWRQARAA